MLADPGRWDRYPYGSGFRDPRPYDRRYWYDAEYEPYRKDSYAYADRWVRRTSLRGTGSGLRFVMPHQLRLGVPGSRCVTVTV